MDKKHIVLCDQKPADCHEMLEAREPGHMLEPPNTHYVCHIGDTLCPFGKTYELKQIKE